MLDDQCGGLQDEPTPKDEFDDLVLDEDFVRAGIYEPPARTRFAIARYEQQKTSRRHAADRVEQRHQIEPVLERGAGRRRLLRMIAARLLLTAAVASMIAAAYWMVVFR